MQYGVLFGLLLSFLVLVVGLRWILPRRPPLPPGPRSLPLIGNLLDLPKTYPWKHWAKQRDIYGPISSVSVLGKTFIILNEFQTAVDLLDRRSAIYSNRPVLPFAGTLIGWDQQMILSQYGDRFRSMRKLVSQYIGSRAAIIPLHPTLETETRRFLIRTLEDPSSLISNIRLTQGAIFLLLSHGYAVETDKPDPLVTLVENAAHEFYIATMPGAWMVDLFPGLMKLPGWLPGTGFKKTGAVFRQHNFEQAQRPHEFVKHQINKGIARPSFTLNMLQQGPDSDTEDTIQWAANSLYGGGTDTTVAALSVFFLAMVHYPAVQAKAQSEIDSVVGPDRLPVSSDRAQLPYIEALMKEVLRWYPIGPLGIPHCTAKDDVYQNFFIPEGSIVLYNIWEMARDSSTYSNPDEFRPDRFMQSEDRKAELDPRAYVFGFGRRACPGQELAEANMFLLIAMTLSVFKISGPQSPSTSNATGAPPFRFTSGTVSHPMPFEYTIQPRSPEAESLIRSANEEYPPNRSDGPDL